MDPLLPIGIRLPKRSERTLLRDLHAQLRSAILEARLGTGLRLPSTRALAAAYGVSRNTAVATYDRLLSEGYVVSRRGSGTRVAATLPKRAAAPASGTVRGVKTRRVARYWRSARAGTAQSSALPLRWSFRLGVPDPDSFPMEAWRRLSLRESLTLRTAAALETEVQGVRALREAIARHVSYTRAVACAAESIVVTAGAQQAFDLLVRVLVTPSRTTAALEDPGYPPLRAAFEAAGAKVAAVPVDDDGMVVEALPRTADIVCVTPSHQFPLGCVLSAQRRVELLDFAQSRHAVIIEDDYDGEFRYTDRPLDALQTLDRLESVFYVGTFSKTLLPMLRLGYIVAPPWAVAPLLSAKAVCEGAGCGFTQSILAALITQGHLARHVRRMQRIYGRRRHALLDTLRRDVAMLGTDSIGGRTAHRRSPKVALERPVDRNGGTAPGCRCTGLEWLFGQAIRAERLGVRLRRHQGT